MCPDPIISFNLFGKTEGIHLYGVLISVGLLLCFAVLFLYARRLKYDPNFIDFIFYVGIASIIVGFGSAALFQAFYNFIETGVFEFSGITFLGGLIGGVVTFLTLYMIFRKRYNTRLCEVVSYLPCCILIAHSFGRLGCLCAGCCHGEYLSPTPVAGGINMDGSYGWGYYVPTQLYEAIFLFVVFAVISFLVLKYDFKHGLSVYVTSYGLFRFIIEFLRDDRRGALVGSISPSQFWSLLMIPLGIALIFFQNYMLKKRAEELNSMPSCDEACDIDEEN